MRVCAHRAMSILINLNLCFLLPLPLDSIHHHHLLLRHLVPTFLDHHTSSSLNLGDLVRSGRRVLLGYQFKGDRRQYFDSPLLWPNVQHLWAQTDEFEQLERYIEGNVCKEHSYLTSVMAELTPSFQGVLFFKYHGLRELAQQVNVHYDHWFRQRWWRCANIVAADFFLGSDIVEIAVDVNRRRFVVAAAAATPTTNLTRC